MEDGATVGASKNPRGEGDRTASSHSHRPYRPALGVDAALAEIERDAGAAYDADVATACVTLFRESGFEVVWPFLSAPGPVRSAGNAVDASQCGPPHRTRIIAASGDATERRPRGK